MKVCIDYNILFHLYDALFENISLSVDHKALIKIWQAFQDGKIRLIPAEAECINEFQAYLKQVEFSSMNIEKVEQILRAEGVKDRILTEYELFKQLPEKIEAMIGGFFEYGWFSSSFFGGPEENYELLEKIRTMLQKKWQPNDNPDKDRDARHIMHCILYGCDFFLTMDGAIVKNFKQRYRLIEPFMIQNGYFLNIVNPSELLTIIEKQ
jgi:hypothetical protein